MPIRPDADAMISFLNSLCELDRAFLQNLIDRRLPCNKLLAEHPTVQVSGEGGAYLCGLLGILNGYFGTYDHGPKKGWGPIMAVFEDGQLIGFRKTTEDEKAGE